jgi:hypothetical protein
VPVNVSASDNAGVSDVQLTVNGTVVATASASPYSFSRDSTGVANGSATLVAYAYDAAGKKGASAPVTVNVSNAATTVTKDTTPPIIAIVNPVPGMVSGTVSINTKASDNNGAGGISQWIYIDGVLKAKGTGATLSYSWNTRKISSGTHTIQAVAKDAAGNQGATSVQVTH